MNLISGTKKPPKVRVTIYLTITGLLCLIGICGFQQKTNTPLNIGSRLELFVDDYLIESLENAELRLQTPLDEGPVIYFDKPWEGFFSAYTTIIKDGDKYRMYYRGLPTTKGEASNEEVTCYAESADGIHWIKPDLKIYEVMGTMNNNVVLKDIPPASHNFSPFLDSGGEKPVNGKFKALGGLSKGLVAFSSDDGIHWKKLRDEPVLTGEPFDSQNISFWSESEGCYVCYFRKWTKVGDKMIRSVGRSTSADFFKWSPPLTMDFGNAPAEELYTNQTSPYFRAPHIYIATAARFFPGKQVISEEQAKRLGVNPGYFRDCSDAVLITSRGGNKYQRTFMEGFLRPGIGLGNWVSRTNYPALNIVQTGETEMSFYVNQDYAQPTSHLRRYSLRIDGFSSLHADYAPGEMTTKVLTFTGSHLVINFSTSAAGYILVELLDSKGNPVQNYSSDDCITLIGNEISRVVEWKSGSDLIKLKGAPIRLHFKMKDADLYSLRFE
jgi:hypothetical protein